MSDPSTPQRLDPERRRRRAALLRDRDEARELRERIAPARTRLARDRDLVHLHLVRSA